jgi:hypothetical protein
MFTGAFIQEVQSPDGVWYLENEALSPRTAPRHDPDPIGAQIVATLNESRAKKTGPSSAASSR